MTAEDNGSGKISYTIREMFAEIKQDLKNIDAKLENKAERSVVESLEGRLRTIEVQRQSEQEWGRSILAEYGVLRTEHSQMKTDISVMKGSRRDFALWTGLLITFTGTVISVVYTLHQLIK